jgi:hypothetical protein
MELNLRAALEKNGAKLDESQITFVEGLEVAIRATMLANNGTIEQTIKDGLKQDGVTLSDETAEQLRTLGVRLDKMETTEKPNELTDLQKRMLRVKVRENHAAICDAVRSKTAVDFDPIYLADTRAATKMTNSNVVSLGAGVVAPKIENVDTSAAIAMPRYPDNFILDVISNRQTTKVVNTRFKLEYSETEGVITIVAECAEKPLISYTFVKNAISRDKIAGRIEWCEEFEIDNEALFAAIVRMIENDIIRKWNNVTVASIVANATAYTAGAYSDEIVAPNTGDVATVLSSIINAQEYNADTIVLNPVDFTLLLLSKTTDENYINHPIFNNANSGFKVIANNVITAGNILVFDSSTYSEEHTGLDMRVGQYASQFINNEWTLIGEMFTLLDTAAIDKVATMYGSIATIEADLLRPAI